MLCIYTREKEVRCQKCKRYFVGYDKASPSYLVYFPECDVIKKVRCVRFTNIFEINKPEEMSLDVTSQRDDFVIEQKPVYVNDCDNVDIEPESVHSDERTNNANPIDETTDNVNLDVDDETNFPITIDEMVGY